MQKMTFTPGTLVSARGREWMVLSGSDDNFLRVRPLSGSEEDQTLLYLPLEQPEVQEAYFPAPAPTHVGGHDAAVLLRDALLLSTRRGAGPFRSFGQITVQPRAYQLVPLLMALKLDPIRLLIADDVGVGKTIEAGLILREMLDRDDIARSVVLCPPHLVDQWVTELEVRFNLQAAAVTSSTARQLERSIPPGDSIFQQFPHTVVSLDYIKSNDRREHFLQHCPSFIIVDEAHTCVGTAQTRTRRYELLKSLSGDPQRHIVLLTATPHSGDDDAFYRLLGVLDDEFGTLQHAQGSERDRIRGRLANHFVQRRRVDIEEWRESGLFPERQTKELTYDLSGAWLDFFNNVLDYCAEVVAASEGSAAKQRMNFWSTLALLRCAASSPGAAINALRTRAQTLEEGQDDRDIISSLFDGTEDVLDDDDVEPAAASDDPALQNLITQAESLTGAKGDPKLKALTKHVRELLDDPDHTYSPVVFCRFIATAKYVASHLQSALGKGVNVDVITGELPPEAREERVALLGQSEGRRVLVATDCLSEGINLQEYFDAVVHYDLSWNPTRHEQREGRVDRFGQQSRHVRATLMYGRNNPVDGAVLNVILRKAERIRKELGVPVSVPDEGHSLTQALLKSVLIRRGQGQPVEDAEQFELFEQSWQNAADKAKQNRTIFAQRRLKPADVLPEWEKNLEAIGGGDDVKRFATRALKRLGSGVEPASRGFTVPTASLPTEVSERLEAEGLTGVLRVDFKYPAAAGCRSIQRSHPLITTLAETLLEQSLADAADPADPAVLGRVGCWVSEAVQSRTVIILLRMRHQLITRRGRVEKTLLVEEATALAKVGDSSNFIHGVEAFNFLAGAPLGDIAAPARDRQVKQALQFLLDQEDELERFSQERAAVLLEDHLRVRTAAFRDEKAETRERSTQVHALPRPDIIGVYVLLPKVN